VVVKKKKSPYVNFKKVLSKENLSHMKVKGKAIPGQNLRVPGG